MSRLLDLGADPNLVTEDGRSAFYMASEFGQDKVVKLLLDRWPPLPLLDLPAWVRPYSLAPSSSLGTAARRSLVINSNSAV